MNRLMSHLSSNNGITYIFHSLSHYQQQHYTINTHISKSLTDITYRYNNFQTDIDWVLKIGNHLSCHCGRYHWRPNVLVCGVLPVLCLVHSEREQDAGTIKWEDGTYSFCCDVLKGSAWQRYVVSRTGDIIRLSCHGRSRSLFCCWRKQMNLTVTKNLHAHTFYVHMNILSPSVEFWSNILCCLS